ncbi:MAG: holo-ACP synthase [Phycisphaerales bacterium]
MLAHGIDIVEVARIADMLNRHGERFLERCFTPDEVRQSAGRRRRHEHLAARFAAKEAAMKALGTGWSAAVAWTDIEVAAEPSGRPTLRLHRGAADLADRLGLHRWALSLSHTDSLAIASVIASE